ncbi:MAG: fructokinase [Chloroflexi bacterium]|nr:fructokinase [Chloroflexota bacterium]
MDPQVVCFGELLIDFVALERGVTVGQATRFEKVPGGAPANVAVGLAKLGIPAAFVTQLGDDPFGHFLHDILRQSSVDTRGIVFTDAARTALAFAAITPEGDRSFAFYRSPSADMLMTPEQLERSLIEQAEVFHFGSITLIDEPVRTTTLTAVNVAKESGALVSYDPNLREALWPDLETACDGMLMGLQHAHIVKLSEEELAFLTGVEDLADEPAIAAAAHQLWHDDLQLIAVTRGGEGAVGITPSFQVVVPGFTVEVEDTIGAGDGFGAGLLAGVVASESRGFDSRDGVTTLLRQANAAGALTATQRGAIPALPEIDTLRAFLAGQPAAF